VEAAVPAPPEKLEIERLDLLPLATDRFQDAFPLLPGVVRDPEGRLSFNGSRPSQSILLVNGANVTDPVTGDFAIELPLRAIEEVEVTQIPYSAEYGRVTAAVAEIKTRGGTDVWDVDTGDLLPKLNFRDGKIRGIRAFVPQVAVSGPLKRGKAWFSQGLAYRFVRSRAYDVTSGDDEQILESYDTFTQLDWRVAEEHHLTTTFSYFPGETDNLGLNALTTSEATPEFHSWGWNAAISGRSMFARTLVETTVAVKHYDLSLRPKEETASRLTPEGLRGNYFHNLERNTSRFDLLGSVTHAMTGAAGDHLLKAGGGVGRSRFEGIDRGIPLEILDSSGSVIRRVDFLGDPALEGTDFQLSAFVQDRWRIGPRLGVEAGLRYDYDELVHAHQLAPRFAVAYGLDGDGRTVLRGGFGVFHDHLYLHAGSFDSFQRRVETSFGPDGEPLGPPIVFENRTAEALESPRSTTWNVELDRQVTEGLEVRAGYRERYGAEELLVDRIVDGARGTLLLSSDGASVNRELGVTFRVTRGENELFFAYSKSRSTGDLNNFGTMYQNLRSPLVFENEDSRFDLDVPHRLLLWGLWTLPKDIEIGPGLEWRSGFPYTVLDEEFLPVGSRNQGGRFPSFFSLDVRVTKGVTIKGRRLRVGVQAFNLGSHFNPRDVVASLASPRFGEFLNSVDMGISLRVTLSK
jgi:outer membrane receptor protein involved in Fe transport